eukprot:4652962-Prymnesium_polylepis.1
MTRVAPAQPRDGMQLSLDQCLATPDALKVFLDYARKDLSEENLELWLEVRDFKERWGSSAQATRDEEAERMINQFLNEGSPKQVCIGDARVKEVLDNVNGQYTRDMFALPEEIAYGTLKLDIFPRFEASSEAIALFEQRDDLIERIPGKAMPPGDAAAATPSTIEAPVEVQAPPAPAEPPAKQSDDPHQAPG